MSSLIWAYPTIGAREYGKKSLSQTLSSSFFPHLFLIIMGLCVTNIAQSSSDFGTSNDALKFVDYIEQLPENPALPDKPVSYTLTVENIFNASFIPKIRIISNEINITSSFSSETGTCSLDANRTTFSCPKFEGAGSAQYILTWYPDEGQHDLQFVISSTSFESLQSSQSITTDVILSSNEANQLKTISGNFQRGVSGDILEPFVINVFDANENPIEDVSVNWEILTTANSGTLQQLTTITDTSGQSSNTLSLNTSNRIEIKATVGLNNIDSVFARNLHDPVSVIFVVNSRTSELPGLSRNQRAVAKAMDPMCIALAELGEGRSTEQDDLLLTCNRLNSNDLTVTEIAANLDLLAHEEVSAQGRAIIETAKLQSASIHRRLMALRAGARGVNLAGLNIRIDGQTLPESVVSALFGGNAQGGSAGEEQGIASRWGSFVNATVIVGDRDKTNQETGFNFRAEGITAGVDYRVSNKLVVGGALGYTGKDSDFKGNAGGMEINNWHLTAYSSYYRSAAFYLDGLIKLGKNNIDTRRRINLLGDPLQEGIGDTTGWEYAISLSGGYEYNRNALTFGPYGRLGYIQTSINGYTESASNPGGVGSGSVLTIANQDVDSITAVLGSQVSYAISARNAVYLLQLNGEWEHEFKDNSRAIAAQFAYDPTRTSFDIASDSPDRNYFNLGLGATATFANGRSGFFHYERRLEQDNVRQYWVNLGIRMEL